MFRIKGAGREGEGGERGRANLGQNQIEDVGDKIFNPYVGLFGYLLTFPAIAAYYAMNFTGSSTFTSHSGVQKEMRIAIPGLFFSIGAGVLLLLINHLY